MRAIDLIHKKRLGQPLEPCELDWLIKAYVNGEVPDYQMSAFTMAVCFQGMTAQETARLTLAMAESGHTLDLSAIPGVKVDKHSTGGVGDTTTLVLAPLVASVGVPVAKMSGRGLGHTGGTIDKLESIPGFRCDLDIDAFLQQVREIGVAVAGQTHELAPADKQLYALRDVTDTVQSIPLIASSIMSKKIASGADAIVLDVKVGQGAFMKDLQQARQLASTMVGIGRAAGRETVAVLTNMEEPLGRAIGNALEVREAILTLRGQGPSDLTELCLTLGAEMAVLAQKATSVAEARQMLQQALQDGRAVAKFKEFVRAQGGDPRVADDLSLLPKAPFVTEWRVDTDGVITGMDAEAIGVAAMRLGAGRLNKTDEIDPSVGIVLHRKVGESLVRGEAVAEIHSRTPEDARAAVEALRAAVTIGDSKPFTVPLVLEVIRLDEVSSSTLTSEETTLLQAARSAMKDAYVPYSHFPVGAALRLSNGEIVLGSNVENASYGLANCAERTALFRFAASPAHTSGVTIQAIAVAAETDEPVAPCGACRQVMVEFCTADTPVILGNAASSAKRTTVGELLPYAFGAAQMK